MPAFATNFVSYYAYRRFDEALYGEATAMATTLFAIVGTLSLFFAGWALPAALVGGVFYLLAGLNHALQRHRTKLENTAMFTDNVAKT